MLEKFIIIIILVLGSYHQSFAQTDVVAEASFAMSKNNCEMAMQLLWTYKDDNNDTSYLLAYAQACYCLGKYDSAISYYTNLSSKLLTLGAGEAQKKEIAFCNNQITNACYYLDNKRLYKQTAEEIKGRQDEVTASQAAKTKKQEENQKKAFEKTRDFIVGNYVNIKKVIPSVPKDVEHVFQNIDTINLDQTGKDGDTSFNLILTILLDDQHPEYNSALSEIFNNKNQGSLTIEEFIPGVNSATGKRNYVWKGKTKKNGGKIEMTIYKDDTAPTFGKAQLYLKSIITDKGGKKIVDSELAFLLN